jgi:hypothetical protein
MAKHALCVGINDYPGTGSDLAGCVNDANDWVAYLESKQYQVKKLLDGQATRQAIVDGLTKLIDSAAAGDVVAFTYSGHGSSVPDDSGDEADGMDEMLCPHDVMSGARLLDDDLAEIFGRKKPGARLLFVSDSCHSGTVSRFMPAFPGARTNTVRFLHPQVFIKDAKELAAVRRLAGQPTIRKASAGYPAVLLAACRDREYSYDAVFNNRPNGAFSYFALKALAASPAPTKPRDVLKLVRQHLPSSQYPQTPQLYCARKDKDGPLF